MFRPRQANKRVEIYETTIVADGYGGNTTTLTLAKTRWSIVEDMTASSYQSEAGITDFTNTYKFTFRYDPSFTIDAKKHVLRYKSLDYKITDVKTDGFKHVQQIVIAKLIIGLN